MKKFQILLMFLIFGISAIAQNQGNDAASLRQQMSAIRKSTNWSDPEAAKAANAKIQDLAAKLTKALRQSNPPAQQQQTGNDSENDAKTKQGIQDEMDDYNNKLWNQMMKIVQEGGQWDMAEPLRKEIVEEYKEDENPTVKNQEWLQSMSYLLINLSLPQVQVIIDQMPMYKGIKTLIITTEKPVASINLSGILTNAKDYQLDDLYIINFGPTLTSLPPEMSNFPNLQTLGIYNNGLTNLPASVTKLTKLSSLQIQDNPISTILPTVNALKNLKELGVSLTKISGSEISQIQKTLPECKITNE